ncbi:MAG: methionine--tRNA ligase [Candidatus Magasanikbacteria bacterium CG_4_10_14_0_2_um_filter_33_14]|uniref:methionine--tRNA ligase n=1 Tax=Candidatus Magasanikbacteria bacterium CG_4_10_14_0_2_um_filter_33_14 TaxID=1974636 RepID=A0A2M7VB54_9BACT|nr:MAG: methionine--tRNA ligase [Candidatus Magasanikbacteria bacterium CG_4_10_14_0_2_um_filter_33_14]
MNKNKYYISTAIPYVNGKPHIGHALEYIQTDAVARYQRLLGKDVFFLSGTDENSLKNVQAAEKAGKDVQEFVDEYYKGFYNFKDYLNISFDDFIRTTEERHFKGAKKLWQSFKSEDLEKRKYKGLYCVGCEAFYKEEDLEDGKCPDHKTEPEVVEEENWFFKLSNYQEKLKELLDSDIIKVTPDFRKNEWSAFIERGLEDFSISRSVKRAHNWGVPVPGDESQIMYVWVDALSNYITALNYGEENNELFQKYWNQVGQDSREVVHVIGKGIGKFHVLYWPAMLLSAGLELPTSEFIHGYLTNEGEKISKSLGNTIDPKDVVEKYGTDAVRYYLLGAVSSTKDGDFSVSRFEEFYTAHLVNGIGNLTSRVLTMIEKYSDSKIPARNKEENHELKFLQTYLDSFDNFDFEETVKLINELVGKLDSLISVEKPWEKAKNGEDISNLLYTLVESLRLIAILILPIIPETANKILTQLGITEVGTLEEEMIWGKLKEGSEIKKAEILFPRLEK